MKILLILIKKKKIPTTPQDYYFPLTKNLFKGA